MDLEEKKSEEEVEATPHAVEVQAEVPEEQSASNVVAEVISGLAPQEKVGNQGLVLRVSPPRLQVLYLGRKGRGTPSRHANRATSCLN